VTAPRERRAAARAWTPSIGAWPEPEGVRFRVWAPTHTTVELVLDPGAGAERRPLASDADGLFAGGFADVAPGRRYQYLLDGDGPFPDPASRSQPDGVHGPSAVVDAGAFDWSDQDWPGLALSAAVIYELHVGTFTPAGTFAAVIDRLPDVADLGVTAIELMPVADFPGSRNWGYDGVSLFAPARCYGAPDDLRRLVDAAHGLGLAVLLDVVYNHFGPDGAYASAFSPFYFSTRHTSPWGAGVNLDGAHHGPVRAFFIENALHWLHEYHMDGLRLDATHALVDDSPVHLLEELTTVVRGSIPDRRVLLVAEDDRNLATIIRPRAEGGWGLDAVWADDFHHHARRLAAGDRDGYFQDFSGSAADLAATLAHGWFYRGQHSAYGNKPRGTDPAGVPVNRMVICLQNHDQIGNRAFGDRLGQQIDPALLRALTALLLLAPETPLLFMGQEWAADTPFLYFTDHAPDLGRLVTEGRRREFSRFTAFADQNVRARIPDPQAASTFEASRLRWSERTQPGHAGMLALHRALLHLRRDEPALRRPDAFEVAALGDGTLALTRAIDAGTALRIVVRLAGAGAIDLGPLCGRGRADAAGALEWTLLLTTGDPPFRGAGEGAPPELRLDGPAPVLVCHGPAAVVARTSREARA
jgi:maltooligosyltrehalose trehalohydrolase